MRGAPAVTEIATSHFPPRQTANTFLDVDGPCPWGLVPACLL